jgi:hypothetical protein
MARSTDSLRDRHDLWREAAIALAAIVITLGSSFVAFAGGSVSESKVRHIVETESPYVRDRGAIQLQLSQLTTAIGKLTVKVDELRQEQTALRAEIRRR